MRRAGIALSAIVLAAAAAGCGGEDGEDTESAATGPEATATEAPAEEATPEATPAAKGALTPLGTTLKIGEPAVIKYKDASNNKRSTIQLTPKSIRKGPKSDFANVDLDARQKTATPYYAEIEVVNVGKGDLGGASPATYINGVDDRGQDQNELIFFGDFPACDHEIPKQLKPGGSYEACLVYLIPKGGSLEGFHWIEFDPKTGDSDLYWE